MTNNIKYSDVQNAFKEGATPNEDDYQKLITLARVGGLALGATDAAPTTLLPGVGLEIKDNKLAVKAAEKQGLSVSANGVGVEADMTSVAVTGAGLEVMLKKDGGLAKEGGLHVVAGPGLKTDDKGLQIALTQNSGLTTTGGLAVAADGKSGLEINKEKKLAVRLSQKNKFLEAKDDGLAINDDGIKAIRDTLKAVSIEALNQAIEGTNQGAMKDTHKPEEGSVEARIATALNDSYNAGHAAMEGTLVRPTIKTQKISVPLDSKAVELSKYITPMEGEGAVLYLPVVVGEAELSKLGALDYLTGKLLLTGKTAGEVTVLAVQTHKTTGRISAAAELSVEVTRIDPPYKFVSPQIDYIPLTGLDLSNMNFFDKNEVHPADALTFALDAGTTKASVTLDGNILKPVAPYSAGIVCLSVTSPITEKYKAKSFSIENIVKQVQDPMAYKADFGGKIVLAHEETIGGKKVVTFEFPQYYKQGLTVVKGYENRLQKIFGPTTITAPREGNHAKTMIGTYAINGIDGFISSSSESLNIVWGLLEGSSDQTSISFHVQNKLNKNTEYNITSTTPHTLSLGDQHLGPNNDDYVEVKIKFS